MEVVRIWLYKVEEVLEHPECMVSKTNQGISRVVRGDFKYYKVSPTTVIESTRKEADEWAKKTGDKVET